MDAEDLLLLESASTPVPTPTVVQPVAILAPDDYFRGAVNRSYNHLRRKQTALPWELYQLLIPQSIVGHAQQGHVGFQGTSYPNTTTEDVLEGLKISFNKFWHSRQAYIEDIRVILSRMVRDPADPRVRRLVNQHGQRLGGCSLLDELTTTQDTIDFLAGFVYASRMDTYDPWRKRVRSLFGTNTGGGKTMPIDLMRMRDAGLTLVDLATQEHDEGAIDDLINRGIVYNEQTVSSRSVTNGYVRQHQGLGVSDDAALITAGFFRGAAGFVGALFADFVDTIDKSAVEIRPGGQDEELGKYIAREAVRNGIDLGLDDLTTTTWIALAAIDPMQKTQWLHCSQRYFYEYSLEDRKGSDKRPYYPAQMHLKFALEARKAGSFEKASDVANGIPSILTSFNKRSNRELYRAFLKRLEDFQEKGHIKAY